MIYPLIYTVAMIVFAVIVYLLFPDKKADETQDRWYTWRWDFTSHENVKLPYTRISRWRRGSFLTVYKFESPGHVEWRFLLPFNFVVGKCFDK
jgi:hypothetical protein